MKRNESKVSMPEYTRDGYVARHEYRKSNAMNQIRDEGGKVERHLAPGAGHRAESVEGNKRSPSHISGMAPAQRVTGGCPGTVPKGKMRNESDSGLR